MGIWPTTKTPLQFQFQLNSKSQLQSDSPPVFPISLSDSESAFPLVCANSRKRPTRSGPFRGQSRGGNSGRRGCSSAHFRKENRLGTDPTHPITYLGHKPLNAMSVRCRTRLTKKKGLFAFSCPHRQPFLAVYLVQVHLCGIFGLAHRCLPRPCASWSTPRRGGLVALKADLICWALEGRVPGRLKLATRQQLPVHDAAEPVVVFEILVRPSAGAHPDDRLPAQKAAHEVLTARLHVPGVLHTVVHDVLEDGHVVLLPPIDAFFEEWRGADDHLEEEHAERPPVNRLVVARAQDHLRGQVLRGPAQREGLARRVQRFG
mmetsp:Transcript_21414/g.48324  ORF Transcript_21414/g.48324 Transcript_21414/m.48324 type:complete len:318 (+) Transcript_21414:70-1023(+)